MQLIFIFEAKDGKESRPDKGKLKVMVKREREREKCVCGQNVLQCCSKKTKAYFYEKKFLDFGAL